MSPDPTGELGLLGAPSKVGFLPDGELRAFSYPQCDLTINGVDQHFDGPTIVPFSEDDSLNGPTSVSEGGHNWSYSNFYTPDQAFFLERSIEGDYRGISIFTYVRLNPSGLVVLTRPFATIYFVENRAYSNYRYNQYGFLEDMRDANYALTEIVTLEPNNIAVLPGNWRVYPNDRGNRGMYQEPLRDYGNAFAYVSGGPRQRILRYKQGRF